MKAKVKVGVLSFGLCNDNLTPKFQKFFPVDFEMIKVNMWIKIICHNAYVFKWNKPSKEGLRCKCKPFENKSQADAELKKLSEYVEDINKRLGTKFRLERENV